MKKLILAMAVATAAFTAGAASVTAALPTTESGYRSGIEACVIVDKAAELGVPESAIPNTVVACRTFKASLKYGTALRASR